MTDFKAFCNACEDEKDAVEALLRLRGVRDEEIIARTVEKTRCTSHATVEDAES